MKTGCVYAILVVIVITWGAVGQVNAGERESAYDRVEQLDYDQRPEDSEYEDHMPSRLRHRDRLVPSPWEESSVFPDDRGSYAIGCCQTPAPFDGYDCCDTRDCGWFRCEDMIMPEKLYRR